MEYVLVRITQSMRRFDGMWELAGVCNDYWPWKRSWLNSRGLSPGKVALAVGRDLS